MFGEIDPEAGHPNAHAYLVHAYLVHPTFQSFCLKHLSRPNGYEQMRMFGEIDSEAGHPNP